MESEKARLKRLEFQRAYYYENKEKRLAYQKAYYQKNKDKFDKKKRRDYMRAWRAKRNNDNNKNEE